MESSASRRDGPILVLGMHRSGTSALTRLLGLMGAWLGEEADLLPAHPVDNPTGYWERRDILIAQDGFLDAAGHAWDRVADFDLERVDESLKQRLETELTSIVQHFDTAGKVLTVKDPRLCLLLPIWQRVLDDPVYVIAVRDPREVAASMQHSHRGVYTSHFLLALWEKYLRCALDALRGRSALFVSYERLLADPAAESARLLAAFRAAGIESLHAPSQERIDAFFDRNLHRSAIQPHVVLSPSQKGLSDWLVEQTRATGPVTVQGAPDGVSPDPVLREFEASNAGREEKNRALAGITEHLTRVEARVSLGDARIVDQVVTRLRGFESSEAMDDLRNRLAQIESAFIAQCNQLTRQRDQLADERVQLVDEILAQSRHTQSLEAERAHLQGEIERLGSESAALRARNIALTSRASALEHGSQVLRESLSWRVTAPLRWLADFVTLRVPRGIENLLFGLYYRIPGLNAERKRRLIVWFHDHASWLTRHTLSYRLLQQERKLENMRERSQRMDARHAAKFLAEHDRQLSISIVVTVHNAAPELLAATVQSVLAQFYPHWQLCIVDDASTRADTREILDELTQRDDKRILVKRLARHQGHPRAANAALELATGTFVGFLAQDALLTRDALLEVARHAGEGIDFVYSDEDRIAADGTHYDPVFKPDFSPDLLLSTNYIGNFIAIRRTLIEDLGGLRSAYEGAEDYDLILRATERTNGIVHVPMVLYHGRAAVELIQDHVANPDVALVAGRALDEALTRRGVDAAIRGGPLPETWHVRRVIRGEPLVSILVPFRDNPDLLATCVESILGKSTYRNFEFIGIDNGSAKPETHDLMRSLEQRDARIRFVRHDVPFNYSAIMNFGVRQARGDHLLLLNDDTEVISADWIEALLEHSQRPEVGVVGAKLLYPDDTFQHGGVIIGLGGVAGHSHWKLADQYVGYCARAQIIQNVSAVTFACAMMRREVFDELDGLNETDLTIAYNDIDFCLRAREAGYLVVYTPCAALYHHESKTRGLDAMSAEKQARYEAEIRYMQQRHADLLGKGDPYYNVNLSLVRGFELGINYMHELPR